MAQGDSRPRAVFAVYINLEQSAQMWRASLRMNGAHHVRLWRAPRAPVMHTTLHIDYQYILSHTK